MASFVTVDIGGTQIRAAAYPESGTKPLSVRKISTRGDGESAFDRIVDLIHSVWPAPDEVLSITVAAPGPVDPYVGIVASAPNIPGWDNFPLRERLENVFHVPAHLGNDANLAALGEWRFGAGQGHSHLLYITISTGIGGGVIVDNNLLLGAHGLAAELGHVTVLPDGPVCGCGQRGHLEAVAAGPAIAAYVREQIALGAESSLDGVSDLSARAVGEAAVAGDRLAIQALARAGELIGIAVADFLAIFNPSIVIFGGGVSFSGDVLLAPLRRSLQTHVMDAAYLEDLVITTAALGDDAGLLGALALAHSMEQRVSTGT
jgi:glucokinase